MNYGQSLSYLESLQRYGIKLGLDNVRAVLDARGNPHRAFPSIHVAGTNGKGSVAAMLAEILTVHGFRAGLYTSPHLVRLEERIRIGAGLIRPRQVARGLSALREEIDGLLAGGKLVYPPTFFEVVTALALDYFAEERVDIAVLEVGMGGRFDATNAVTPIVSVITTIAHDHQKYLGRTLGEIAFEKAGIVKPGVPVVCGVRGGEALRVIRRRAKESNAPCIEVFGRGAALGPAPGAPGRFLYDSGTARYTFRPSLPGAHQGDNAAVALRTAEVVGSVWKPLDARKSVRAVGRTRWEGRLEVVGRRPTVILDGAHNPEGAAALAAYIRDSLRKPVVLVFDAMKDKDIRKIGRALFPLARKIVLTRVPMARAASPEDVLGLFPETADKAVCEPDIRKALSRAVAEAGAGTPVVVAGSLFLVGEAKKIFNRRPGRKASLRARTV
jgi:dihydrofolate synthase / folylpolyglutamate synthase